MLYFKISFLNFRIIFLKPRINLGLIKFQKTLIYSCLSVILNHINFYYFYNIFLSPYFLTKYLCIVISHTMYIMQSNNTYIFHSHLYSPLQFTSMVDFIVCYAHANYNLE